MRVSSVKPWTMAEFFDWAVAQDGRCEFDGVRPVAMTGGSVRHDRIAGNIRFALMSRLRGTPCEVYGPNSGINTIGAKVRYPDALVVCSKFPETERLVLNPIVVFQVLSLESEHRDCIEKLREYAAVPSVRQYVIGEFTGIGATSFFRKAGDRQFKAEPLTENGVLSLAALEIEIPLSQFYDQIDFDHEFQCTGLPEACQG